MENQETKLMEFYLANAENEKKKLEAQLKAVSETIESIKSIIERING